MLKPLKNRLYALATSSAYSHSAKNSLFWRVCDLGKPRRTYAGVGEKATAANFGKTHLYVRQGRR